ncbi:MAG: ribose 5-phosphate isomerase B, partial [Candidatus Deferrimicrobiaceae bacterium]
LGISVNEDTRMQRPMITELDVRDLPSGTQLPIPANALVTPLARQVAMERSVEFIPEVSGEIKSHDLPRSNNPAGSRKQIIALGADHGGFELKELIRASLSEQGFEILDCGTHSKESVDYPDFALAVAQLVASGEAWRGIIIDGAGIGSCMAANKVPGVLAAMCYDQATAVNSREHNNANVLTLGAGLLGANLALQIVKTWLATPFGRERHARRVEKIHAIEHRYARS